MLLLNKFGMGRVPAEVRGATLLLSAEPLPVSAGAFVEGLKRLDPRVAFAGPPGGASLGLPSAPLPEGTAARLRWLRRARPRRLLLLGPVPDGAALSAAVPDASWINAPVEQAEPERLRLVTLSDPRRAGQVPGAVLTGDPLIRIPKAEAASAAADETHCERFREQRRTGRWIVYFAGTGVDEEALAYGTFFKLARRKMGFLVLAPRDPARYEPVYRDALKYRLPTNRHNRLSTSYVPLKTRVYYIEDPQTLDAMYRCADVVVVGGTLIRGAAAPDLATPLRAGRPVVVGPAFASDPFCAAAVRDGAAVAGGDEETLVDAAFELLNDPARSAAQIAHARRWLELQTAAVERVLAELANRKGP